MPSIVLPLTSEASSIYIRRLRMNNSKEGGRTVLTVLYLAVLGLFFIVPVFYYFRIFCEQREMRRLRELEIAALNATLQHSENFNNSEEARAAWKKYREERRARILQLFSTVKMTLRQENFPHLRENNTAKPFSEETRCDESITKSKVTDRLEANNIEGAENAGREKDMEVQELRDASGKSIDLDNLFVEVPTPGLTVSPQSRKLRLVSNLCTICLCNYEIGAEIVWSSNMACEHAFHLECIEEWLMNQREGPLCPCCRRDFVLDPLDVVHGEKEAKGELRTRYGHHASLEEGVAPSVGTEIETLSNEFGHRMDDS